MTLHDFKELLEAVTPRSFRYEAAKAAPPYIVWHEYRRRDRWVDNLPGFSMWRIQADCYVAHEEDGTPDELERALRQSGISFTRRVVYEPELRLVRHIFDCEVVIDGEI